MSSLLTARATASQADHCLARAPVGWIERLVDTLSSGRTLAIWEQYAGAAFLVLFGVAIQELAADLGIASRMLPFIPLVILAAILFRQAGYLSAILSVVAVAVLGGDSSGRPVLVSLTGGLSLLQFLLELLFIVACLNALRTAIARARAGESRIRALFDSAPVGIVILDPVTLRFVDANAGWTSTMGYDREETIGLSLVDIDLTQQYESLAALMAPALAKPSETQFEMSLRRKDGSAIDLLISAQSIILNGEPRAFVAAVDNTDRKRAELALRESAALLEQFIERAPVAISMLDHNLRYIVASRRMREWRNLGGNVAGRSIYALSPWLPEHIRQSHQLCMDGVPQSAELDAIPLPDGSTIWLRWEMQPWRTPTGEVGGIIVFFEDLTDQVRANDERQHWAAAVEAAGFGILVADGPTRTISFANSAFAKLSGWNASELRGMPVREFYAPEEFPRSTEMLQLADQTGHAVFDTTARRADGSIFPVQLSVTSITDNAGDVAHRIASVIDITERKATEEALRDSQLRFSEVFDNAAVGLTRMTFEGVLVWANARFCEIAGLAATDLIGRSCFEILHEDYFKLGKRAIRDLIAGRIDQHRADVRVKHRDGSLIWARLSVTLLRGRNGTPSDLITVVEDISALRDAEDALRHAQRMEAIGSLAGGMAHDFNNLLGVTIASLDLLRHERPSDSLVIDLSGEALEAAWRGAELTQRLLAFARRQPLQPQAVNLNSLTTGMTQMLDRLLGEDIVVSLDLAPNAWFVFADPAQIEAAIASLAANARDAMPHGGGLIVKTTNRHVSDDDAEHAELSTGDYVVLEVADTGTGIGSHVLPNIFEPFYTTHSDKGRSGLGLSMVFGFVKQSAGHVFVTSELGVGTTLRIFLPRVPMAITPRAASPKSAPEQGGGETILVVEDNAPMRRVLVRVLRTLGYKVLQAELASDAIVSLENTRVDLLLTDIIMPGGMSGVQLAELARGRWPELRVLLTSGFTGNDDAVASDEASRTRGFPMIAKPYRTETMADRIREVLQAPST